MLRRATLHAPGQEVLVVEQLGHRRHWPVLEEQPEHLPLQFDEEQSAVHAPPQPQSGLPLPGGSQHPRLTMRICPSTQPAALFDPTQTVTGRSQPHTLTTHGPSSGAPGCFKWPYTAGHCAQLAACVPPLNSRWKAAGCQRAALGPPFAGIWLQLSHSRRAAAEEKAERVEFTQLVFGLPDGRVKRIALGGAEQERVRSMTSSVQKTNTSDEILFEEPYKRLLPELGGLPPDDIVEVNIDIPTAVATVFGVLPQLSAYRNTITQVIPGFDIARFDQLEDYTMALSYASTVHATASRPVDGLAELNEEGTKLRGTLQGDILTLVSRGLINPSTIKNYSGLSGYKNVASDLQIQGQILKDHWATIEGKCATTLAEVEQGLKVAAHLLRLAGLKEQSPVVVAAAADMRKRAFTLFTRAYDEARRAIIFLRWHEGDADTIAPSLYAGRGGSKKKTPTEESISVPEASTAQTTAPMTTAAPAVAQAAGNQPFMT